MKKNDIEKIIEDMCDNYCKMPFVCKTQDELDAVCNDCPLTKLYKQI